MVSIDLIILANFIIIHKTLLNINHTESAVLATKENSDKNLPSRPAKLTEVLFLSWSLSGGLVFGHPPPSHHGLYRFRGSFSLWFRLSGTGFNVSLPLVPQSAGKIQGLGVKSSWLWIPGWEVGEGTGSRCKSFQSKVNAWEEAGRKESRIVSKSQALGTFTGQAEVGLWQLCSFSLHFPRNSFSVSSGEDSSDSSGAAWLPLASIGARGNAHFTFLSKNCFASPSQMNRR